MISKRNPYTFFRYRDSYKEVASVKSLLIMGDTTLPKPEISIVITTYKRPELLKHAIDSALLQKGYTDYDIIIVDNEGVFDRETDTEKLVKSYDSLKVFYYKNEINIGYERNLNRAIELSNGKWAVLLHDDDILKENFMRETVRILKKPEYSNLAALYIDKEYIEKEKIEGKKGVLKIAEQIIFNSLIKGNITKISMFDVLVGGWVKWVPSGVVYDKCKFIQFGGFKPELYPPSDRVFLGEFIQKYDVYYYYKRLVGYRVFDNASSERAVRLATIPISNAFQKEIKRIYKYCFVGNWYLYTYPFASIKFYSLSHPNERKITTRELRQVIPDLNLKYEKNNYFRLYYIYQKILKIYAMFYIIFAGKKI